MFAESKLTISRCLYSIRMDSLNESIRAIAYIQKNDVKDKKEQNTDMLKINILDGTDFDIVT